MDFEEDNAPILVDVTEMKQNCRLLWRFMRCNNLSISDIDKSLTYLAKMSPNDLDQ
jgi:hypothetical protein